MQARSNNNAKVRNEIQNLFKGPAYLLPLEVPLVVIGVILIIGYRGVKFTVKQSVKILIRSVVYTINLVDRIIHYLSLLLKIIFIHAQHFSMEFYRNIVKPITVFTCTSVFPVIYNISKRIINAIVWFCVWYYQTFILATFKFCYLHMVVPISKWIIEFAVVFCSILRSLFRKFRLACKWMWQNILYPSWRFILSHVLLLFYQSIV